MRKWAGLGLGVMVGVLPIAGQTTPPTTPAETAIVKEIRSLRAMPDDLRGAKTGSIALEIRALPVGRGKTMLAMGLASRATEGDPGRANLQAVTTTLAQALREAPEPEVNGKAAYGYRELAGLVRYEGMEAGLDSSELRQALDTLAAEDAELDKKDFTLKDLHGKSWTLSDLHGKVVLVNFWATWCPPCRKEMPDLDALEKKYGPQGLVVLSISDEPETTVAPYVAKTNYGPTVLLDPGAVVAKEFHVEGIPHTFVFGHDGKMLAQSIDMRTRGQFEAMLARAGL
jgi:thiol-disulfide isomerase/thioredoxin